MRARAAPAWGEGRSCAGRSGDAVLAEQPLVVLVGFPDAAECERSRSSGLHFPLGFAAVIIWIYSLLFETVAHTVTHAGFELAAILLLHPPLSAVVTGVTHHVSPPGCF